MKDSWPIRVEEKQSANPEIGLPNPCLLICQVAIGAVLPSLKKLPF